MVNLKSPLLIVYLTVFSLPAFAGSKNLTIAYPSPTWNSGLPIAVGQAREIFAAEAFNVNAVLIASPVAYVAALINGDADYAVVGGVPAVTAIARGAPLVVVGGYSAQLDYMLIGAKDIKTFADLKGKIVGVTNAGGLAEFATVEALARKGLLRDKDYQILFAGNSPARAISLGAGRIHAAPFSAGEKVALEKKGYSVLLDIGDTLSELPFLVILTTKRKVQSVPEEIVSLLRAFKGAMDVIKKEREAVLTDGVTKRLGGNAKVERQNISHYAKNYSITISEVNIKALVRAARLRDEAAEAGGVIRFFDPTFSKKVLP